MIARSSRTAHRPFPASFATVAAGRIVGSANLASESGQARGAGSASVLHLGGYGQQASLLGHILDRMRDAVFLVSADRELSYANAAARQVLDEARILKLHKERVTACAPAAEDILRRAVAGACNSRSNTSRAIAISRAGRASAVLTVLPFEGTGGEPNVLLILAGQVAQGEASIAQVQQLFRLTRSEAEICLGLAEGLSITEIAARRVVSPSTVRVQLKSASAKLGCKRQAEIVLLLSQVSSWSFIPSAQKD